MSAEPLLEQYFREADGWDRDVNALRARSERMAWRVALGALLVTLLSAVALVVLLPLKRVEPYVVRVDASTGIVDVVPRYESTQQVDEVVTRFLLSHYVRVCEQFYLVTALSDYETCGAFNSAAKNQELYQRWTPANPQSPLRRYRDGTSLRTQVTSVTFLEATRDGLPVAQVRYQLNRRPPGGGTEEVTRWIATLQYDYTTPSRDARVRQLNPMGLQIVEFRREPEVMLPERATRGPARSDAGGLP